MTFIQVFNDVLMTLEPYLDSQSCYLSRLFVSDNKSIKVRKARKTPGKNNSESEWTEKKHKHAMWKLDWKPSIFKKMGELLPGNVAP